MSAFLYAFNSFSYYAATIVIVIALHRMPKNYRLMWVVPIITCSYFATVYLGATIGFISDDSIGFYTRPLSSIIPIQLAAVAWLFSMALRRVVKDG